jgi:hypothetical protein
MEQSENIKDMSIDESSDFWDEHDFGEFDDVQEEKNRPRNSRAVW